MHVYPRFEPILSSNVSITWGARHHKARVARVAVHRGPRCERDGGFSFYRHSAGCGSSPANLEPVSPPVNRSLEKQSNCRSPPDPPQVDLTPLRPPEFSQSRLTPYLGPG